MTSIPTPLWGRAEPTADENGIWLPWLVRLRWVAITAQLVTILFSYRMLWSPWLVAILGFVMTGLAIGNLDAQRILRQKRTVTSERLLLQLATETIALTVFFVAAGGPDNPFIVLYFCLLYTSPSPRDGLLSRMPSSA